MSKAMRWQSRRLNKKIEVARTKFKIQNVGLLSKPAIRIL